MSRNKYDIRLKMRFYQEDKVSKLIKWYEQYDDPDLYFCGWVASVEGFYAKDAEQDMREGREHPWINMEMDTKYKTVFIQAWEHKEEENKLLKNEIANHQTEIARMAMEIAKYRDRENL
jgi:hypothetical protein